MSALLVRTSNQKLEIRDLSQTGLDLNTYSSVRMDIYIKLTTLPSAVSDSFGLIGKYQSSAARGYQFYIDSADRLQLIYGSNPGGAPYLWRRATTSTVSASDVGNWIKLTVKITPSTQSMTFFKDDVEVATSVVLSGGTSIANVGATFEVGDGNNTITGDYRVAEVSVVDTSSGSDVVRGYWPLLNDALDASGNGNHLSAAGSGTVTFDSTDHPVVDTGGGEAVQNAVFHGTNM